jgi:hypothetical protein
MKVLTFTLFLITINFLQISAQTEIKYGSPDDKNLPDWAREMYKEHPDYLKVMDLYDAYYKRHKFEKNTHTQYYKRLIHDLTEDYNGVAFGFYSKHDAERIEQKYRSQVEKARKANKNQWTCIGPINFDKDSKAAGGTSGAAHCYTVEQSLSNPNVIYVGTATSGLWRSNDKGINWHPVTSQQYFNKV